MWVVRGDNGEIHTAFGLPNKLSNEFVPVEDTSLQEFLNQDLGV